MEEDLSKIVMMITLKMVMDVLKIAKLNSDGLVLEEQLFRKILVNNLSLEIQISSKRKL